MSDMGRAVVLASILACTALGLIWVVPRAWRVLGRRYVVDAGRLEIRSWDGLERAIRRSEIVRVVDAPFCLIGRVPRRNVDSAVGPLAFVVMGFVAVWFRDGRVLVINPTRVERAAIFQWALEESDPAGEPDMAWKG